MAQVKGFVFYEGEPLTFGSVMFVPKGGPPARGLIKEDGSFELHTFSEGDGAFVGMNRVRVTSYEVQKPENLIKAQQEEMQLGKSYIPKRYTRTGSSGISVEVKSGTNENVMIELFDE